MYKTPAEIFPGDFCCTENLLAKVCQQYHWPAKVGQRWEKRVHYWHFVSPEKEVYSTAKRGLFSNNKQKRNTFTNFFLCWQNIYILQKKLLLIFFARVFLLRQNIYILQNKLLSIFFIGIFLRQQNIYILQKLFFQFFLFAFCCAGKTFTFYKNYFFNFFAGVVCAGKTFIRREFFLKINYFKGILPAFRFAGNVLLSR